ncbi:SpRPA12-like protein [Ophiocordyceps sinensis CO18]|uniref:DNA-directed RNA polymerase subunit n=1 Tax=Ophiocordyceps sinensis (strain Co18 / CGMCC 3.14243) TaxID=911162 RepID=T4ZXY1_OPHSC|nr:SpRPA12-like protein [Ophiocordyceps sinensis CO18]
MVIQFCDACGDMIPISKEKNVDCELCGTSNESALLPLRVYATDTLIDKVTVTSTSDFPSELRRNRTITAPKSMASTDTWSTTDVTCPYCKAKEVRYTTLQLRGADEGSTMFYFCPDCSTR